MYERLLLSAGGGLISNLQKANPQQGSVSILIGLGGTGIDCLRTIKTQVYDRIKPDDPNSITLYKSIRFLGVDTDTTRVGQTSGTPNADRKLPLAESEFFSIANQNLQNMFRNRRVLAQGMETQWLRWEDIPIPNFNEAGAGGIRSIGRYMMMLRSNEFLTKVKNEITYARGETGAPVNIHLFSGISGGTGAGSFLDVCYLLRTLAGPGMSVTILGYFFLPDVNLSVIPPMDLASQYVPKNGYASMQELDYCMRIQTNGGAFEQRYPGIPQAVRWDGPPVHLCHLISATNCNGMQMTNPYDYAMNVTAEYVLDFLADSTGGNVTTIAAQQSNMDQKVTQIDIQKEYGVNVNYLSIGAACAKLPLREINTYLASILFGQFSRISQNVPGKEEVEKFFYSAVAPGNNSLEETYEALYNRIRKNADDSYEETPVEWREALREGAQRVVPFYTNQTSNKMGEMTKNQASMCSDDIEDSLINRIRADLVPILRDITRGPIYVAKMFDAAADYNLKSMVKGLIAINNKRMKEEQAQNDQRKSDHENAQYDFENKRWSLQNPTNNGRYNSFLYFLVAREQHDSTVAAYEALGRVLNALDTQLDMVSGYYATLSGIMKELIKTFKTNYEELTKGTYFENMKNEFAKPLIDFNEAFIARLDREIFGDGIHPGMNIGGMFEKFINYFLSNTKEWIEGQEQKICQLVTEFFMQDAFQNFAGRNITEYLEDRYEIYGNPTSLAQEIYNDWMIKLKNTATPMFCCDTANWALAPSRFGYISVPTVSAPVNTAAQTLHINSNKLYSVRQSSMEDRIFVMTADCAFPISAYNKVTEYEALYSLGITMAGNHYYEGKELELFLADSNREPDAKPKQVFDDWRKMPSLLPQGAITLRNIHPEMAAIIRDGQETYEKAVAYHLLSPTRQIMKPQSLDALRVAVGKCRDLPTLQTNQDIVAAEQALDTLKQQMNIPLVASGLTLQNDGSNRDQKIKNRITEDYLVSSPAICIAVKETVEEIDIPMKEAEQMVQELEKKLAIMQTELSDRNNFCDALFTGVISFEGSILIVYHWIHNGRTIDQELCKYGTEYPFSSIPVYQAFLSYVALPQQIKDDIRRDTIAKMNGTHDSLAEGVKPIREAYAQRMNSWLNNAENTRKPDEIKDFIGIVKLEMDNFCATRQL